MNRLFLLAPLALVALASCSNDDDQPRIDNADAPVSFSASINGTNPSRAYDREWESGDKIGISGTSGAQTYRNVAYTTNGNGNFTVANAGSEIYYQSTDNVTFTAYYPWNDLAQSTSSISASTWVQSEQKSFDFLWAQATGSKASPNVNFTFTHKMSKLVLTVKKGTGVSFDEVKAAVLSLAGFVYNGSFDIVSGMATASGDVSTAWSFANSATTENNAPVTLNTDYETASYTLILYPQEFTAALPLTAEVSSQTLATALDFTAANTDVGDAQAKNELIAGRQYNMSVTLHKTALTVDGCTISDWNNADGGNFDAN